MPSIRRSSSICNRMSFDIQNLPDTGQAATVALPYQPRRDFRTGWSKSNPSRSMLRRRAGWTVSETCSICCHLQSASNDGLLSDMLPTTWHHAQEQNKTDGHGTAIREKRRSDVDPLQTPRIPKRQDLTLSDTDRVLCVDSLLEDAAGRPLA